jgi:hypothetical protein
MFTLAFIIGSLTGGPQTFPPAQPPRDVRRYETRRRHNEQMHVLV